VELEYKIIGKGKEVLVIETGIGSSFYDWYPFVQRIEEDFTVVLYHRAGYGNSQNSSKPRTTKNIAEELNLLIEGIGIKDKFILMGHSFGGLCVQHYAKIFGNNLKGIMLIDSTSYNFKQLYILNTPVMSSLIEIDKMVASNMDSSIKSKEELKKINEAMISSYRKLVSEVEINYVEEFFANPMLYKTIAEEFENWEIDSKEIKENDEFPNIPLIVIARDNKVAEEYWVKYDIPEKEAILYEAEWRKLQVELSKLSTKGKLIVAENSDHEVYLDRPDVIIENLKLFLL
jgi:pimeloyl-ACP methyl ester carboxylesterase